MSNLRGVVLMVASMAGFAVEDALIKIASATVPVGQILMTLGIGGVVVFGLIARRQGIALVSSVLLQRPVMIRNLGEMGSAMAFVTAISMSPLSTVSAILQAAPLAVTLGAALFLGAPVGWRRWTAILVGFGGVLLIVRPGGASFDLGAVLALVSVFLLAARDIATRIVPPTVPSVLLASYGFAAVIPAGAVLLMISGGPVIPGAEAGLAITGALVIGPFAYYAIVAAMRLGDIAVVTPFRYTRLVFAVGLGIAIFGERPDALTLLGAGIVIASGLYTLIREARLEAASKARARGVNPKRTETAEAP
jgi:drug/metabolite transporter (DMT)-like permease